MTAISGGSPASPAVTAPVVTVRGEAHLETPPDLAQFSASVTAAGPSADRVRAELAELAAELQERLRGFENAIERSTTSALTITPVFDRRGEARINRYRGQFTTEVAVADFGSLPALVVAVTGVRQAEINGPWWSLRRDSPVFRQARLAAIDDAVRRATDYAAAFGAELLGLVEVSDLDGGFGGREFRVMAAAARGGADEPVFEFEPAVQTVSGQVTARFTISAPDLNVSSSAGRSS